MVFRRFLGMLFVFAGIFFLSVCMYFIIERYNPQTLAFASSPLTKSSDRQNLSTPVRVVIETLAIDLPIVPSVIRGNEWETSKYGVSYLSTSPLPGEKGNSILYGHNWPNLLGSLSKIRPGDGISIAFSDGSVRDFVVAYTTTVSPSQVEILKSSVDSRLTLYTCTGFLDSKRFVVTAMPKTRQHANSVTF